MEAPLSECTISEQRAVIRFLWAEGIKPSEIHRRMLVQYGDKFIGQRKVYEWVEMFKNGETNVKKSNMLCTPGFATNQKHFSVMELRSLLNVVKSVWISRETMLKNDVIIMSPLIFF
jgi:hypothetical protein